MRTSKNTEAAEQRELQHLSKLSEVELFRSLVRRLLGKDHRRRGFAMKVLIRIGKPAVVLLVRETCAKRRSNQHRLLLLQALEKLGQPISLDQFYDLTIVTRRYGLLVQNQLGRMLFPHCGGVTQGN
jgi:hypothetical protein